MAITDKLFGIHAAALQVQSRRMELIASNIANADTPGFAARDVDFAQAMAAAAGTDTGAVTVTNAAHIGTADAAAAPAFKRVSTQPSLDGNTVDVQTEQAQFADAALHYQASMSFIDARLRSLMTAITGQ